MTYSIRVKELFFTYPDGTQALEGVDLEIEGGEIFGLTGLSGSGKSTFMLTINGLLKGEGLIEVAGMEVKENNLSSIRKVVGLVFQNSEDQLFCPTVYEDIAFGIENSGIDREEIRKAVGEIAKELSIEGLMEKTPHSLSAGEKKLVAIATTLVMKPEIIIFDEPFANLDYRATLLVFKIIKSLKKTVLIISQDLLLLPNLCDRVGCMEGGTIKAVYDGKEFLNSFSTLEDSGISDYISLFRNYI